jgi:hypothetical protein
MKFRNTYTKILSIKVLFFFSIIWANQVQLITTHKKSNGTLLRIVTSSVLDSENIAGWSGQENWFYITLNGTQLSSSSRDYITFEPPLLDIEITENNESVQLGYLFERPIEDFEIFHSNASRVILIQVWESLNDSMKSEVKISEGFNNNRVFSLPKNEAKGSPFYDSFVYAKEKYGSEKYFVWYNNWYSTEDEPDKAKNDLTQIEGSQISRSNESDIKDLNEIESPLTEEPKPLIVKKKKLEISGPPPLAKTEKISSRPIDISFILDKGLLSIGIKRPNEVKALQNALVSLGYYLGSSGVFGNGVDGDFGLATEEAVMQFQLDRGFNNENVDGIVGQGTQRELFRALAGEATMKITRKYEKEISPEGTSEITKEIYTKENRVVMDNSFGSLIQKQKQTAKELLNQKPVTTQVKRVTRKLQNSGEISLLPPDLSKRKTFLKLSCNLEGANVFIDGALIGSTPIPKKLAVNPGWHRVRVVNPNAAPPQFSMAIPDYQDVYVPKGRTQKIRINLPIEEEEE